MSRIEVLLEDKLAGWVTHEPKSNRFSFDYASEWIEWRERYALSPQIPLVRDEEQTAELHSTVVRQFFENLMPEGRALDEAAAANRVSKSNLVGLMVALGRETSGALRLRLEKSGPERKDEASQADLSPGQEKRLVSHAELSARIKARPYEPFSVWDGRVRLSIAGYQDKIAVYEEDGNWFLVDGDRLASTVILKPEPLNPGLEGLTSNEFFCMRLARNVGLPVASVKLVHVPEPVLEIARFDRFRQQDRVRRLHVIDACQALGLSAAFKYERPYGDNPDVKNIRDGASLPQLFEFLGTSQKPAAQRILLLRWVIFQVLIGNTDAHAKNISFFSNHQGFGLTPTYDLVSVLAFNHGKLMDAFALAIGDAFLASELTPYEWANLAVGCKLKARLVSVELGKLVDRVVRQLEPTAKEAIGEGADAAIVNNVCDVVRRMCARHQAIAPEVVQVDPELLLRP